MKTIAIRSRIAAKLKPVKKEKKAPPVVEEEAPPVTKTKIQKLDVESGAVLAEFASVDEAVEKEGLNLPNLKGALKNGNKYKGTHWKEV